jgi:hypothetical protein
MSKSSKLMGAIAERIARTPNYDNSHEDSRRKLSLGETPYGRPSPLGTLCLSGGSSTNATCTCDHGRCNLHVCIEQPC